MTPSQGFTLSTKIRLSHLEIKMEFYLSLAEDQ